MGSRAAIDTSPEKYTSATSSPEPRQVFRFRPEFIFPEYCDDEKDDESAAAVTPNLSDHLQYMDSNRHSVNPDQTKNLMMMYLSEWNLYWERFSEPRVLSI